MAAGVPRRRGAAGVGLGRPGPPALLAQPGGDAQVRPPRGNATLARALTATSTAMGDKKVGKTRNFSQGGVATPPHQIDNVAQISGESRGNFVCVDN